MERCKFQALVALRPDHDGSEVALGPSPCRMVLWARNSETGERRMFRALVSSDGDGPYPPGSQRMLVTLRVAGDEIGDYLDIGARFHLWLGGDVGKGVVSRRLFVLTRTREAGGRRGSQVAPRGPSAARGGRQRR